MPSTYAPPAVAGRHARGSAAQAAFEQREKATIAAIRALRQPACPRTERDRLRQAAVQRNLPLAHRLARGFQHRGESLEDLLQVAALALVKAVDGYDPGRERSFTGYATPTILGEIKRHFRDRVWTVHVPRGLQERCLEVTRIRGELTQRLHRAPSAGEIADAMGVTEAEVRVTEASTSAYRADSLNRPVSAGESACERQDFLSAPDDELEHLHDRLTLQAAIRRLAPRARHVLDRYFFGNLTQAQIADELGTSQMSVSRLLAQSVTHLRAELADQPGAGGDGEALDAPVRTYTAGPGCVVATVHGVALDDDSADRLRDTLIDLAMSRRTRTLVVDLRRVTEPDQALVRVLWHTHRACGHAGTRLYVVNAGAPVHDLLRRTGLTRLFPCRPVTPPRSAPTATRTSALPAQPAPARAEDTRPAPVATVPGSPPAARSCPSDPRRHRAGDRGVSGRRRVQPRSQPARFSPLGSTHRPVPPDHACPQQRSGSATRAATGRSPPTPSERKT
jgi:RNA polymerase sigma-B factor